MQRVVQLYSIRVTTVWTQVVVGEVDSLVMVWNLDTGEDVFTFSDTHRSQIKL